MGWAELSKELDKFSSSYTITDSHVHVGEDIDGHRQSAKDILRYTEYGIDRFVIFPFNEIDKKATMPFYRNANERIAGDVKKKNFYEVFGFFRLYPLNFKSKPELEDEIDLWYKSHGLKGIKLGPGTRGDEYDIGYITPIIKVAGKEGLPVLVHTDDKDAKADPCRLVEIARENPNCNIIVGHMGKAKTDAIELASEFNLENIFWDLSVSLEMTNIPFGRALKLFGPEKILFGSDSNCRDPRVILLKFYLEMQKRNLHPNDIQKILSKNIENLLS